MFDFNCENAWVGQESMGEFFFIFSRVFILMQLFFAKSHIKKKSSKHTHTHTHKKKKIKPIHLRIVHFFFSVIHRYMTYLPAVGISIANLATVCKIVLGLIKLKSIKKALVAPSIKSCCFKSDSI